MVDLALGIVELLFEYGIDLVEKVFETFTPDVPAVDVPARKEWLITLRLSNEPVRHSLESRRVH
ncbi:MAG: hypothetical protein ABSE42_13715 [Bryobacteraceae bacterium]|jgi:hypothetical protein